jgi:hypothetical protein
MSDQLDYRKGRRIRNCAKGERRAEWAEPGSRVPESQSRFLPGGVWPGSRKQLITTALMSVVGVLASHFWRFKAESIVSWLKRQLQTVQITTIPVSSCGSRGDTILQRGQKT